MREKGIKLAIGQRAAYRYVQQQLCTIESNAMRREREREKESQREEELS